MDSQNDHFISKDLDSLQYNLCLTHLSIIGSQASDILDPRIYIGNYVTRKIRVTARFRLQGTEKVSQAKRYLRMTSFSLFRTKYSSTSWGIPHLRVKS